MCRITGVQILQRQGVRFLMPFPQWGYNKNIIFNGTFSLVFDIWTLNSQTAYIGIIISYINSDFELIYKLISFEELIERYISIYIYYKFRNILKDRPALNFLNIKAEFIIFFLLYIKKFNLK